MSDDSEIAITIIPDDQANVDTATEVNNSDTVKVEAKDPALQDLMSQYKELEAKSAEAERRAKDAETRRLEAEREASKHREDAETSRKREKSSQLDTVTTAISASEQDVESAKAAIRAAKSTGDIDAETDALDRLAKARATMLRLDEARQDIEARIKAPPQRERAAPSNDPVEVFVQNRTPETASWIRSHPEYVRSEKGLKKLTAADAVAQAEDLIPDTPEYFARVEEYLGIGKTSETATKKDAPTEAAQVKATKQRETAPVAPGASVSSSGNGNGGSSVQLTKREADAAQDGTLVWNYDDPSGKGRFKRGDAIGLQEMARRKLHGMKAGLYDRSFSEG